MKFYSKKSGDILCKGNIIEIYDFIDNHLVKFGMRWLFKRQKISPNGYYFYKRNKEKRWKRIKLKNKILNEIEKIYHSLNEVSGSEL